MHTRLLLALGSAAWLAAANLAGADEVGIGNETPTEGTHANASDGDEGAMPDIETSGVEFRRRDRSGGSDRTGRNDRPGSGGNNGRGSDGSEGGESGGGDVD